jgi:predicted secreted protein
VELSISQFIIKKGVCILMAQRALGTKILINQNEIAGLTSIAGVSLTAETLDVTTLTSNGGYREFTGGFKDGGEVTVSGYFEPGDTDGQIAAYNAFESGDTIPFSILYPQGAAWSFNGVVTAFSTSAELEDLISFEATIKTSGKPTLNFSASTGLTELALAGTGGTLSPAFDADVRYYTFAGVTADAVTITATGAGQTIKMFVDGAYIQDLISGAALEVAIAEVGSKKITLMANETGKAPKLYEVIVVKVS